MCKQNNQLIVDINVLNDRDKQVLSLSLLEVPNGVLISVRGARSPVDQEMVYTGYQTMTLSQYSRYRGRGGSKCFIPVEDYRAINMEQITLC